jgi:predicted ATPase with chaperone activity
MVHAGLVGSGNCPRPGRISLAAGAPGGLFLGELPEFAQKRLVVSRELLEDTMVTIARALGALICPGSIVKWP